MFTSTPLQCRDAQSVKMGQKEYVTITSSCDHFSHRLTYFVQSCFVLPRILCVGRLYICDMLMNFSVIQLIAKL